MTFAEILVGVLLMGLVALVALALLPKKHQADYSIAVDGYEVVTFQGYKVSTGLFQFFAIDADNGALFRFVKREDGVITVETVKR